MKKTTIISVLILIPGIICYLLFRPKTLFFFTWLNILGIGSIPQIKINNHSNFQNYLVYSLPNMLWLISLLVIIMGIWKTNIKTFMFYYLLITSITIGSELLQKIHIVPGTFDYIDLISLLCGALISIVIYLFLYKRSLYAKETNC